MLVGRRETAGLSYAEVKAEGVVIGTAQDALDLMAGVDERRILLRDSHLNPDFFRLRTGFAGEVLQKFMNYGVALAVVGDFSTYPGDTLRDFIRESNRTGRIVFAPTADEAVAIWSRHEAATGPAA
jgi:hypothetical protein